VDRLDRNIGKKLDGRYDIQEIIGVGGMAVVYKAYDSIDDRTVAVKILKEEFASNDEFLRRFKNESKAIAVLSHPNIVKVFDVSFSERLQYIVMEYIDGITLKEYIDQQKALLWKEAVHFTIQILRALQHAHKKGIIHRDIKPQNIMLLQDGTIKVTDFGIAHFANSETRTMTDKAIGSVHYISPEQARGEATDDKADIYSVGVMLFEMLTGKLPFEADSAVSVAIMQMQTDPKRPREINNSIPEGLEEITLHAMQKEPSQRYQSAGAMLKDIDDFKNNPSIHFEYKYFIDDNPTKFVDVIKNIKGDDNIPKKTKKKNSSHVLPVLAGIAAAVVLVLLGSAIFVMGALGIGPLSGQGSAQIPAPNLVGQKYNDVMANSDYKKFKITPSTGYSETVPEGSIIIQSPAPPMKIKPDAEIKVTVSKGPLKAKVPDVANTALADAESQLKVAGFTFNEPVKKNDDSIAAGNVISTDPAGNTTVNQSTVVTITVSIGKLVSVIKTPDVTKKSYTDAKNALEGAGLKIGTQTYISSALAKDTVVTQTPAAGADISTGTEVEVVCSIGAQDASFTVNLPQGSYDIQVQIDGKVDPNLSYKSLGGQPSTIAIPAAPGKYTGAHVVGIFVNGKVYQQFTYDFASKQVTNMQDNSNNGTDFSSSGSSSSTQ
jgi:serine/threonine protein kinase